MKRLSNSGAMASVLVALASAATHSVAQVRHEDEQFLADRQKPYDGPIYHRDEGGDPRVVFSSSNVTLMSWIPYTNFSAAFTSAATCDAYVSPSGREYALIGLSGGTGFVEVTNPGSASIITTIAGVSSLWRDVKVYQTYAYAVSEGGGGIQIIDMSRIDNGVVTLVGSVTSGGTQATHTFEINKDSGYLYRCGGGSGASALGLRIYSLANPASPTYLFTTITGRYIHECQVVNYTSGPYAGKEIAFCYSDANSGGGTPGLSILDVTNKTSAATIVTLTANYQYPSGSFSHQGWLSPDKHYVYLDDELDGNPATRIIDVSNLSAPVQVGTFTNGLPAIDHNLYALGNFIFESNYRSGLRIFDATNPLAPVERAYFDTYTTDDNSNYNGLWDNYAYLPSGIVLGSDIEKGLFVWCVGKKGDMNGDLKVDMDDVSLFTDAVLSGAAPTASCGGGDLNGDGMMDGLDIAGFAGAILTGP